MAELWLAAQLGERDESAREDSRLVRRSPDVVMSARSKKSSAVNILEQDLLDLQLLWSSIQGRGCISYDMSYRFQNTKHGEKCKEQMNVDTVSSSSRERIQMPEVQ